MNYTPTNIDELKHTDVITVYKKLKSVKEQ